MKQKAQIPMYAIEIVIGLIILWIAYTAISNSGGLASTIFGSQVETAIKKQCETEGLALKDYQDFDNDKLPDLVCDTCIMASSDANVDTKNDARMVDKDGDKIPAACDVDDLDVNIGFCKTEIKVGTYSLFKPSCEGSRCCKKDSKCGADEKGIIIERKFLGQTILVCQISKTS